MKAANRTWKRLRTVSIILSAFAGKVGFPVDAAELRVEVTVDRGRDIGQAFGTLFEMTSRDGSMTIGAGFANGYGTRYRSDRHELAFFVRPRDLERPTEAQPLPRPNDLCGTYLFSKDGVIHSTYGGSKRWEETTTTWIDIPGEGGTDESMRIGDGTLKFGESRVTFDDRIILDKPARGTYQIFFYANGHLCFYQVNRGDGGYRHYTSESDGYSKLYACPWTPADDRVDLSKAVVIRLPIVGETTFAWGVHAGQIVTGSNIGGFYVFENGRWNKLLEPNLKVSYQLYSSMAFGDRLLMGQYPTGRLFEFDGRSIADLKGWPPVLQGVSASAREAQTTAIYGGEVFVGVWPWGELWRYHPDRKAWRFERRMFEHPRISDAIVHPYDAENRLDTVPNQWGQRVTSLVPHGGDLFVATSAKDPCVWDEKRAPFLAPEKWKSYGSVFRLSMPGHASGVAKWTDGPTRFEFRITGDSMTIRQDGRQIAQAKAAGSPCDKTFETDKITWGKGLYGPFRGQLIQTGMIRP